jgi:hypothetical protein
MSAAQPMHRRGLMIGRRSLLESANVRKPPDASGRYACYIHYYLLPVYTLSADALLPAFK